MRPTRRSRFNVALAILFLMFCSAIELVGAPASKPDKRQTVRSDASERNWWKNAVIYEVYPRSFQDTNGDGIGDLNHL